MVREVGNRADRMRHPGAVYKIPRGARPSVPFHPLSTFYRDEVGPDMEADEEDIGAVDPRLPIWLFAISFPCTLTSHVLSKRLHDVVEPCDFVAYSLFSSSFFFSIIIIMKMTHNFLFLSLSYSRKNSLLELEL